MILREVHPQPDLDSYLHQRNNIMNERKEKLLITLIIIVIGLFALCGIGWLIYVYTTYGGKPINELPSWVLPYFIGRK